VLVVTRPGLTGHSTAMNLVPVLHEHPVVCSGDHRLVGSELRTVSAGETYTPPVFYDRSPNRQIHVFFHVNHSGRFHRFVFYEGRDRGGTGSILVFTKDVVS